jgi:hypothetical protein
MKMSVLEYKICGIGIWIKATVSQRCAYMLALEYERLGWPTKIDGEIRDV